MPLSRIPGKQDVVIPDQPVKVEGPYGTGSPPGEGVNPLVIGGQSSAGGNLVNAGDIVEAWFTNSGALLAGAAGLGNTGSDGLTNISVLPDTYNYPTEKAPLSVAQYVYDPINDYWVKMRGTTSGIYTIPGYTFATILNLTTAAVGSNWTAFASTGCTALDVSNVTGADIEYRRGGTGNAMRIAQGASRMIVGITNADEIQIRRVDFSNTQVVVTAEAFQ